LVIYKKLATEKWLAFLVLNLALHPLLIFVRVKTVNIERKGDDEHA
jgi:hypothetical protein